MSKNVSQFMTKKLITVAENESIEQALMIMKNHQFRHLPVVRQNSAEIIGIVSDRDLYKGLSINENVISTVMSQPVIKFDISASIPQIIDSMVENKNSAFLLTKEGDVKGIITSEDLLMILAHILKNEKKKDSFIDNYSEFANQMTGSQFNPNLIF